jgi:hypothetical protein
MMTQAMGRVPLEPDVIVPSHFLPRTMATPEKRLLLAVLEEAVRTFQRYVLATGRRSRAMFTEVETWFASEDTAWLYSFVAICDALGIDATYVRSGLGLLHQQGGSGRRRPVVRPPGAAPSQSSQPHRGGP